MRTELYKFNKLGIDKDIKLLRDFFIQRNPRKVNVIRNGKFYIRLTIWTDNTFSTTLSHGFEDKKKKKNSYELTKQNLEISEKIIKKDDFGEEKSYKEKIFILKGKQIIPYKQIMTKNGKFRKGVTRKEIIEDFEEVILSHIFVKSKNKHTSDIVNVSTIKEGEMRLNKLHQLPNIKKRLEGGL